MNIFKRTKRLWKLSKKDPEALEDFMNLSDKQIMDIPDEDQKAVFLGEGTQEEFKEQQREDKGFKGIFGL